MSIDRSPQETQRFGVRSAKGFVSSVEEVSAAIEFCSANSIEFAIIRCGTENPNVVHALESEGMRLMDTLVFFSRRLDGWSPSTPKEGVVTRLATNSDLDLVNRIAREAFQGYAGHYHADPRLDRAACDAVYVDWSETLARASDDSNMTLLAMVDDLPAGYMSFRAGSDSGEAVLGGVLESARRRGVYQTLLAEGIGWLRERRCATAIVSSQISNVAVQKVWTRLGFEPHHSLYTFHGWF